MDITSSGEIVGIEILDVSKKFPVESLFKLEFDTELLLKRQIFWRRDQKVLKTQRVNKLEQVMIELIEQSKITQERLSISMNL